MQISILAVGTRMPRWVNEGFDAYARRLPPQLRLDLQQIPKGRRSGRADSATAVAAESQQLMKRARDVRLVIALDDSGPEWSTPELARQLRQWLDHESRVALMIGGPDGLSEVCRRSAAGLWSLSRLTLPHGMVRVIVAEQLYRAWTLLTGHPYHRS